MKASLSTHGVADRSRHYSPRLLQHLEKRLQQRLKGEVHFEEGALDFYSRDASSPQQRPLGVVRPRDTEDVFETLQLCSVLGVPITPRGAGTSLSGVCCNRAIILDTSRWMNRILEIDPQQKVARVEPGVILDDLNREARKHHLLFGPDPVSRGKATLGGMIGNNAGGPHSLLAQFYGNGPGTSDQVLSLEVATYSGERVNAGAVQNLDAILARGGAEADIVARLNSLRTHFRDEITERLLPQRNRRAAGFLLEELLPERGFHVARALCGTQGSCVTLLEATLQLIDDFAARSVVILAFHSQDEAIDQIPDILGTLPTALEYLGRPALIALLERGIRPAALSFLPRGEHWLLVEYGAGSSVEACHQADLLVRSFHNRGSAPFSRILEDRGERTLLWDLYETSFRIATYGPIQNPYTLTEEISIGWETTTLPVRNLRHYLHDFKTLVDSYQYKATLYGNLGQGVIHSRIDFGAHRDGAIEQRQRFTRDAALLASVYGGSYSGGHGLNGNEEIASLLFGESLATAFAAFKGIWDPQGGMNPGTPSFFRPAGHPFPPRNAS